MPLKGVYVMKFIKFQTEWTATELSETWNTFSLEGVRLIEAVKIA